MIGKTLMLFFSLCLTFLNISVGEAVFIGESHSIHSSQLNEDREYKVYLSVSVDSVLRPLCTLRNSESFSFSNRFASHLGLPSANSEYLSS